ncbi:hypothetical protein F4825DRAFT_414832 [Nemania diffusa]|nr:hypothetical protein F4825DRAFT_414832 [Nemania diffusa]
MHSSVSCVFCTWIHTLNRPTRAICTLAVVQVVVRLLQYDMPTAVEFTSHQRKTNSTLWADDHASDPVWLE